MDAILATLRNPIYLRLRAAKHPLRATYRKCTKNIALLITLMGWRRRSVVRTSVFGRRTFPKPMPDLW